MSLIASVLTILVGVATVLSAVAKLTGVEQVREIVDHVGVPEKLRPVLPFVQVAGGVGALLGMVVAPSIAVAALFGLAIYYALAVAAHLRVGDGPDGYGPAAGLAGLALVAAILSAVTL